jgi:hypothetical protein
MALIQQQAIEFPFRTEDGGAVINAPRHLLAELRRSAVSTDQPKGLVLLSGPPSVYRLGLCATVDRALAGEPVLYLAGANVFDPFLVGRLARASRATPAHVLAATDSRLTGLHLSSDGPVGHGLSPVGVAHV